MRVLYNIITDKSIRRLTTLAAADRYLKIFRQQKTPVSTDAFVVYCLLFVAMVSRGGTLCFVRFSALGATRRLVLESLLGIELLFAGGERELFAAVPASQNLVGHVTAYNSFIDSTFKTADR